MAHTEGDTQPVSLTDASLSWGPEADPPPADTPAADAPAASSPEAATEPPVETPREGDGTGQHQGPIPFDRHKTILEAERKQRDEFKGKYESLTWAEKLTAQGYSPQQVEQTIQLASLAGTDPAGFLNYYQGVLQSDPQAAAQMRSWAARVLGTGHQQPAAASQPAADAEPQPDLVTEDGKHRVYSAARLAEWRQWNEQQTESRLSQKFEPLTKLVAKVEQAEAERARFDSVYNASKSELAELSQEPYFKEHIADIQEVMRQHGYRITYDKAYRQVLREKVFPTISQTERAKVVADYQQSAAASSVSPTTASPSTPAQVKSLLDPSLKWRD